MIFDASSIYALVRARRLSLLADGKTLDLAFYELGNALWKEVTVFKSMSLDSSLKLLSTMLRILNLMDRVSTAELKAEEILKLATHSGLTFYDSSYLYAAMSLGEELVTEDARLRRSADKLGVKAYTCGELLRRFETKAHE